jgi:hypothetical protein
VLGRELGAGRSSSAKRRTVALPAGAVSHANSERVRGADTISAVRNQRAHGLQPSRPLLFRAAMKIQGINDHFTSRPVDGCCTIQRATAGAVPAEAP